MSLSNLQKNIVLSTMISSMLVTLAFSADYIDSNNIKNYGIGYLTPIPTIYGGTVNVKGLLNVNNVLVENNTVNIYSGDYSSVNSIFAGYIEADGGTRADRMFSINNTINIRDSVDLSNVMLSAANILSNPHGIQDRSTNNVLNIYAKNIIVSELRHFSSFNFFIAKDVKSGDTLLTANNYVSTNYDQDNNNNRTKIGILGIEAGSPLNDKDRIVLIQLNSFMQLGFDFDVSNSPVTLVAPQGFSLIYTVALSIVHDIGNGIQVVATIDAIDQTDEEVLPVPPSSTGPSTEPNILPSNDRPARVNPKLVTISEGRLASLLLVRDAGDIIHQHIKNYAMDQQGLSPFIIMEGGRYHYHSTGKIKSKTFNGALGLELKRDNILLGVFLEHGRGDYKSRNYLGSSDHVFGKGNANYFGGGIFGKYKIEDLYFEGSVRFGRLHNKFHSSDLVNPLMETAQYSIRSNYVGGHIGSGYQLTINDVQYIDFSMQYFWLKVSGKHLSLSGDPIHFKSMNSQRLRGMVDYRYHYNQNAVFNLGLGYEYEFASKVKGTTYQRYDLTMVDAKGGSGLIEAGIKLTPFEKNNLSLDIKARGSFGKRRGGVGQIQIKYIF